jgi:hypothetical protein
VRTEVEYNEYFMGFNHSANELTLCYVQGLEVTVTLTLCNELTLGYVTNDQGNRNSNPVQVASECNNDRIRCCKLASHVLSFV